MDRDELALLDRVNEALEDYGFDYILEHNDVELAEVLVFLVNNYGLRLPNELSNNEDETFDET